ncbi:hypothetical protein CLORY_33790 [Clostridium oryzae]|uniref:Uncharacterized protein n=1 Tax=Clostridium oryzae TaxID=1450648 RepID=A0A1V4IGZ8_9CLOT|nr:hypothetical protein CLORY_33790 [Clostridium oryzae]
MNTKMLTILLRIKSMTTIRANKNNGLCNMIRLLKSLTTNFALVLPFRTVVIVNVLVRGTTFRTNDTFRNRFTVTTINRLNKLIVFVFIVSQKELIIYLLKAKNLRQLVNLKLLVLWTIRILKSPLFKRNMFSNK